MQYPMAYKFRIGEYAKPVLKKEEFYKGGIFAMKTRLKAALRPFPGAFIEYTFRTEDLSNPDSIAIMWEYIRIE